MKKLVFILSIATVLGFTTLGNATLWDRGGGLIYDEDKNITWTQNAYLAGYAMTFSDAVTWIDQLVYQGYKDWRLPASDPSCTSTYNCTQSEIGHLFYTELGNIGHDNTWPPGDLQNTGNFFGIQSYTDYWLGPEDIRWAYYFFWPGGTQHLRENDDGTLFNVWVVRDGDSHPAPEPTTMLLLGLGLMGLVGVRRKLS